VYRVVCNRYLRVRGGIHTHSLEQSVEWLYAFDVHCNAFFPVFLLLHCTQLLLWPLLLSDRFVALLAANTLYLLALSYYWHITFLGFNGELHCLYICMTMTMTMCVCVHIYFV